MVAQTHNIGITCVTGISCQHSEQACQTRTAAAQALIVPAGAPGAGSQVNRAPEQHYCTHSCCNGAASESQVHVPHALNHDLQGPHTTTICIEVQLNMSYTSVSLSPWVNSQPMSINSSRLSCQQVGTHHKQLITPVSVLLFHHSDVVLDNRADQTCHPAPVAASCKSLCP